jgi:hypothetical protein
MTSAATPPRRRFQFRLRTLMIGVTLLAIPCAWVGWQVRIVSHRKALMETLHQRNRGLSGLPNFVPEDKWPVLPWYRTLLGDTTWPGIFLDRNAFTDDEIAEFKQAFPEIRFAIAQEAGFQPDPINFP